MLLGVFVTACNKTESALQSDVSNKPVVSEQPLVSGAPEIEKIQAKGGTKIAVLVNKEPITTNEIQRRAAFVKLRRMRGNAASIATNELIEEAMKMQEARRLGVVVSDAEVSAAYIRFAKGNKMPVNTLTTILNQRGVTKRGFEDYIRASMSWQRAVGARLQAQASGKDGGGSTSPAWLSEPGKQTGKEQEYTIQQIVFIVPESKRSKLLAARRTEATRFRSQLNGCSNAQELATKVRDVTVLDRGRLLESQLPPRWIKEIKATPAGKVTRIQDDPKGLEMIVVCNTREVIGKASSADSELFADGNFEKAASELDKKYLDELKKRAVIERR